jgi:hypothetical protein
MLDHARCERTSPSANRCANWPEQTASFRAKESAKKRLEDREIADNLVGHMRDRFRRAIDIRGYVWPLTLFGSSTQAVVNAPTEDAIFGNRVVDLRRILIQPIAEFLHRIGQSRQKLRLSALGHCAEARPDAAIRATTAYVDISRPVSANSGRSAMASPNGQTDPQR